jgi:pyrroline-5-carboxylate reductase
MPELQHITENMNQRISIIGFGSMGSMISKRILKNSIINHSDLFISTRTRNKTKDFELLFPSVNIVDNITSIKESDLIILCVKPKDYIELMEEIKPYLTPQKHILSITSSIPIATIEQYHSGPVSIAIPTITGEIGEGVSLIVCNSKVNSELKSQLITVFSSMGKVKEVAPELLDIMIELTSCTPGFIGALFSNYVAVLNKQISDLGFNEDVGELLIETVKGTIDLIDFKQMSFNEIVSRVATKGGITEAGVTIINEKMPDVFQQLIQATMAKRKLIRDSIAKK